MAEADTDAGGQGRGNRALWAVLGLFWNRKERRLRALWRLALTVVFFGVLSIVVGIAFRLLAIRSVLFAALPPAVPESSALVVLRDRKSVV